MPLVASGTLPNFLVIGAAKCGTTALYEYLKQHPDVFMCPIKEPRFFALDGRPPAFGGPDADVANAVSISDFDTYCGLFAGVDGERAVGEASPLYLYHPRAPACIQHYIPDARLIAILRDPVERAFSGYLMHVMNGQEKRSFEDALADEPRRLRENWIGGRYVDVGHYAEQLQRYIDRFDRAQLKVYLFDDLKADAPALMKDIFAFLGVDDTFNGRFETRHNVSGIPRNKWLDAFIGRRPGRYKLSKWKPYVPDRLIRLRNWMRKRNLSRPALDPETRARLLPLFRDDLLRLQDLIGRDLSKWLT